MLSSVDLPDPFGPIRPTRSPSEIETEISSNSGFAPNEAVRDWQLKSNGMKMVWAADERRTASLELRSVRRNQPAEFEVRRVQPASAQLCGALDHGISNSFDSPQRKGIRAIYFEGDKLARQRESLFESQVVRGVADGPLGIFRCASYHSTKFYHLRRESRGAAFRGSKTSGLIPPCHLRFFAGNKIGR